MVLGRGAAVHHVRHRVRFQHHHRLALADRRGEGVDPLPVRRAVGGPARRVLAAVAVRHVVGDQDGGGARLRRPAGGPAHRGHRVVPGRPDRRRLPGDPLQQRRLALLALDPQPGRLHGGRGLGVDPELGGGHRGRRRTGRLRLAGVGGRVVAGAGGGGGEQGEQAEREERAGEPGGDRHQPGHSPASLGDGRTCEGSGRRRPPGPRCTGAARRGRAHPGDPRTGCAQVRGAWTAPCGESPDRPAAAPGAARRTAREPGRPKGETGLTAI